MIERKIYFEKIKPFIDKDIIQEEKIYVNYNPRIIYKFEVDWSIN